MTENIDKKTANIVKALAYTENGGKPTVAKKGKTGELKSIFQYTPDTWSLYAKQISGDEKLPLTPEHESAVTYAKVHNWVQEGRTPEQIYSMWNAGEQRPDAYKQNFKGVNKKYGVAYDTPAYVKKAMGYLSQFENEGGDSEEQLTASKPNQGMIQSPPPTNQPKEGLLTPAMKEMKQVRQV